MVRSQDHRGEETLLSWWWDNAKLLHEAHEVHQNPAFFELAVHIAIKHHARHRHPLASGRNTEKHSLVGAAPDVVAGHLLPLSYQFFNGPLQVGEGRAHHGDDVYQSLSSLRLSRKGIKLDKVFRYQFRGHGHVALVNDLLGEASLTGFVLFESHGSAPFILSYARCEPRC